MKETKPTIVVENSRKSKPMYSVLAQLKCVTTQYTFYTQYILFTTNY